MGVPTVMRFIFDVFVAIVFVSVLLSIGVLYGYSLAKRTEPPPQVKCEVPEHDLLKQWSFP